MLSLYRCCSKLESITLYLLVWRPIQQDWQPRRRGRGKIAEQSRPRGGNLAPSLPALPDREHPGQNFEFELVSLIVRECDCHLKVEIVVRPVGKQANKQTNK